MARDAEITVTLNTQKLIKQAQEVAPKLEKALTLNPDNNKFLETQQKILKENLVLADAFKKNGDLRKAFTSAGIDEFDAKTKAVLATNDALKAIEAQLLEIEEKRAAIKIERKSLASKKGGYKDPEKKGEAEAAYKAAGVELEKLDAKEAELLEQQKQLNAQFDTQYAALKRSSAEIAKTAQVFSEEERRINGIVNTYDALHAETEQSAKTENEILESLKQQNAATEENIKSTNELNQARAEGLTGEQTPQKKASDTGAGLGSLDELLSGGAGAGAQAAQKSIVDLILEINKLREGGYNANAEFQELVTTLRSFDTTTADAKTLNDYLEDIKNAFAVLKNDLGNPDRLADVFNLLTEAAEPAKKAFADIRAEAKQTGNDVVQAAKEQADQQTQIIAAYMLATQEEERRAAEKAEIEAQLAAQDERRYRERTAWVTAMVALGEQYAAEEEEMQRQELQSKMAYITSMVAMGEQLKQAEEEEAQAEVQSRQNYVLALNAAMAQAQQKFQDTMQAVIDTTDRVESAMRMDGGQVGIAELTRRLNELKAAKKALEDYGLPPEMDSRYELLGQLIAQVTQQIRNYGQAVDEAADKSDRASSSAQNLGSGLADGFSKIPALINTTKRGFGALSKATDKAKASFEGMARNMKSNFKHMLTNVTKYVFGFRSLFFLVRRLRKYIGEGIQGMAKFNGGNNSVNANISKLITSLEFLKNAWATAFSPILSFITPWLSALIDKLASVGNAFSRFLGNLLGVSKVFQAVKGPTKNYAKSLDKAGKSAGGAAKKQKKLNDRLADFDVLHVLGKDNDNDGSGGGSGNNDNDEDKRNNKLWKLIKVNDDLKKKLKKMWEDADFTELGETLAKKLKKALQDFNSKIPEALKVADKVGKSIATFLNGLLSDPTLFQELGKAVANLGNIIVQALAGFFEKYKKGSIGTAIANFLKGVFENFDWKTAGANLGQLVTTFFTELAALFRNFPTTEFMKGIEDFLKGIDWGAVVKSLFDFLASAATVIGDILKGLADIMSNIKAEDIVKAFEQVDWAAVGTGFANLLAGAIKVGIASTTLAIEIAKAICLGLADAWIGAMKEAGVWDDFCAAIQDGDILKAIAAAGKGLVDGIAKGIGEGFGTAVDWVADNLIAPIVDNFKSLFGIHSPSTVTEGWGVNIVEGLANGISTAISLITQKWENIKAAIHTKVEEIKSDVLLVWETIKSETAIRFTLIKNKIVEIFDAIKSAIKSPINGVISMVEGMINKIIGGVNSIIKKLNSLPDVEFKNPFNGKEYKIGFNLPRLSDVSIPRLAQGAVIPPNREFMAMLGDQSHGTNIEAPLDTIKQAVAEVMANNNNAEVIRLLQQLIGVVESKNLVIGDKEIGKANARYTNQQKIIRGTSF